MDEKERNEKLQIRNLQTKIEAVKLYAYVYVLLFSITIIRLTHLTFLETWNVIMQTEMLISSVYRF